MNLKPRDFSEELLEHNSPRPKPIEYEPTPELEPSPKFNWTALFVMVISICASIVVGFFLPGVFDEIIATVIISSIYGFMTAHGMKVKKPKK